MQIHKMLTRQDAAFLLLLIWFALLFLMWGAVNILVWHVFAIAFSLVSLFAFTQGVKRNGDWQAKLFIMWLFISVIFGAEPITGVEAYAVWLVAFVFYTCVLALINDQRRKILINTIIALAFLPAIIILVKHFFGASSLFYTLDLSSISVYWQCFIAIAATGLFSMLFEKENNWIMRSGIVFLILVCIATLAVSQGKTAIAAIMIASLVVLLLRRFYITAIITTLVFLSFSWWVPESLSGYIFKVSDKSSYAYLSTWLIDLKLMADNFFMGIGLGCFERGFFAHQFPAFDGISYYGTYNAYANNEILKLMSETGIIGGLLFLCVWFRAVFWHKGTDSDIKAAGMATVVFICSFINDILALPAMSIMFFGLLASSADDSKIAKDKPHNIMFWGMCYIIVGMGMFFGYLKDDLRYRFFYDDSKSAGQELMLYTPLDHAIYARLGDLSLSGDNLDPFLALGYYQRASDLCPKNVLYKKIRADILVRLSIYNRAKTLLEECVDLEPYYLGAWESLADLRHRTGDIKGTQKALVSFFKAREYLKSQYIKSIYDERLVAYNEHKINELVEQLDFAQSAAKAEEEARAKAEEERLKAEAEKAAEDKPSAGEENSAAQQPGQTAVNADTETTAEK